MISNEIVRQLKFKAIDFLFILDIISLRSRFTLVQERERNGNYSNLKIPNYS